MPDVYVLIESGEHGPDDTALEMAAVAETLAGDNGRVVGLAAGVRIKDALSGVASRFDAIHVWEDARFAVPDGYLFAEIVAAFLSDKPGGIVVAAHTNYALDYVPGLSIRLDRPLTTDCLRLELSDGRLTAVRPVYGGKVLAEVSCAPSASGYMATVRPGAVKPMDAPARQGAIVEETYTAPPGVARRFVRTVSGDSSDVDISVAERLVAVGRGIEEEENLRLVRDLAEAMGAEIACSRPVVDKQWLPKSRQVGTSGKAVKPRVYVAVGISGSFQHMGGVKGDPFLVAINKDPKAPIFDAADVGVVGDLFDILPALTERIRSLKP